MWIRALIPIVLLLMLDMATPAKTNTRSSRVKKSVKKKPGVKKPSVKPIKPENLGTRSAEEQVLRFPNFDSGNETIPEDDIQKLWNPSYRLNSTGTFLNGTQCVEERTECWGDSVCPWFGTCKRVNCVRACYLRSASEWSRIKVKKGKGKGAKIPVNSNKKINYWKYFGFGF